jgi:predicted oxidoreductase
VIVATGGIGVPGYSALEGTFLGGFIFSGRRDRLTRGVTDPRCTPAGRL